MTKTDQIALLGHFMEKLRCCRRWVDQIYQAEWYEGLCEIRYICDENGEQIPYGFKGGLLHPADIRAVETEKYDYLKWNSQIFQEAFACSAVIMEAGYTSIVETLAQDLDEGIYQEILRENRERRQVLLSLPNVTASGKLEIDPKEKPDA